VDRLSEGHTSTVGAHKHRGRWWRDSLRLAGADRLELFAHYNAHVTPIRALCASAALARVAAADPAPLESATSSTLSRAELAKRPHGRVIDVLRDLPGVYAILVAGGGQAEQLLVRGFDARQGSDLAIIVDGVPMNAPGHAGDHGYADLHFLITDALASVALHEGPYAARAGDFATAGTLELQTIDEVPGGGAQVRLTSGAELSGPVVRRRLRRLLYRLTGLASPELERGKALLAAQVGIADGPYINPQRLRRGALLGKWVAPLAHGEARAMIALGSGRWADSGLVPASEVAAGLDEYAAEDPTQGGTSSRAIVSVGVTTRDRRDDSWHFAAYVMRATDRLFENPSGFVRDGEHGDQVEQSDDRFAYGADGYYARAHPLGEVRLGVQARADDMRDELWHDERRLRLAACFAAANPCTQTTAHVRDLAAYVESTFVLPARVVVAPGLRLDQLTWDVEDLDLETAASTATLTATAARARLSPKLGVTWAATSSVDVLARAGGGFRTSDSRAIAASSAIRGIPRVWAGELGAALHPAPTVRAAVTTYLTWQDAEVAWLVDRGASVTVPASKRFGIETRLRADPRPWLALDASLSLARRVGTAPTGDAALDRLFPQLVAAAGAIAYRDASYVGLRGIGLSAQLANTQLAHAENLTLSLVAGHRWRVLELALQVDNLLDARWRETQRIGDVRPTRDAPVVTDLLYSPGAPLTVFATIGYVPP
jgi:outer membrane receptor protein involved in Fe transport